MDAATDVWGLGLVLFEAATGERGRAGARIAGRRLPAALRGVIESSLQPDRAARPRLEELDEALEALVG